MALLAEMAEEAITNAEVKVFDLGKLRQGVTQVSVVVEISQTPTGTGPTLDFTVDWSHSRTDTDAYGDGPETSLTQASGGAKQTLIDQLTVSGRYLRLTAALGGTTPVFSGVKIGIYG